MPKRTGKDIRKPPDCTGNEPTLHIHIGSSGQDIKIQNDKYMSFEINMLVMYHVYDLSTEMKGKT